MDENDLQLRAVEVLELHQLLVDALGERINKYPKVKETQLRLQEMEGEVGRGWWTDHDLALAFHTDF